MGIDLLIIASHQHTYEMFNSWLSKRLAQAVITIFAVISLSFALVRLMPGGPMDYLRAQLMQQGGSMTMQRANQLVEAYTNVNPEQPILLQYVDYVTSILTGDMGRSVYYNEPVSLIIANGLPYTVFVMALATVLLFAIGIAFGAVMAYYEGTSIDTVLTMISTIMASTPFYVLAIFLVFFMGYRMGWFPTGGIYNENLQPGFSVAFLSSLFYHATLPVFALVVTGYGSRALSMRGNSISILGADYMRVADLRGLPRRTVISRYLIRNAILPMYTEFLIAIGFMFGGSVILEVIFSYYGIGYYLYQAVNTRDSPLMMGAFLVITLAVVFGILIGDMTYGKIDPRAGGAQDESY